MKKWSLFGRICGILMFALVLLLHNSGLATSLVQLHDTMSVEDMRAAINDYLSRQGMQFRITGVRSNGENGDYDCYSYYMNQSLSGGEIIVFANKAGKISSMMFVLPSNNGQAMENFFFMMHGALHSLGLADTQANQLMIDSVENDNQTASVWCVGASRKFMLHFYTLPDGRSVYQLVALDE